MYFVKMYVGIYISVLSLDLLYLYYAGSWTEGITFIRISELALLYISVPGGIAFFVYQAIKIRKEIHNGRNLQ